MKLVGVARVEFRRALERQVYDLASLKTLRDDNSRQKALVRSSCNEQYQFLIPSAVESVFSR